MPNLPQQLTHLDHHGRPQQVDVSDKAMSARSASARACIRLPETCRAALAAGDGPKGDVLAVARIAGIQAAKRTSELIPLCHQIPLHGVQISETLIDDCLCITAEVRCDGRTGVEMEALTAVSVAALTVYDMLKALSHDMVIESIELIHKDGGKHGRIDRSQNTEAVDD